MPTTPVRSSLDALRRADWLTGARATAYGRILFWVSLDIRTTRVP